MVHTEPSGDGTLRALIERVERATGPDREIDAVLFILFPSLTDGKPPFNAESDPWHLQWTRPAYTSSLDAVVVLVERELDDREWARGVDRENRKYWARIGNDNWDEANEDIIGYGKTAALALLLAFLRAKHEAVNAVHSP